MHVHAKEMKRISSALKAFTYLICVHIVQTAEVCYRQNIFGKVGYIVCSEKCCGSINDKYCCDDREASIIIGSVVGVAVFFGIALSLITCCCCHRNERKGYTAIPEGSDNPGPDTYYDIPRTPSGPPFIVPPTINESSEYTASRQSSTPEVTEVNEINENESCEYFTAADSEPNVSNDDEACSISAALNVTEINHDINVNGIDAQIEINNETSSSNHLHKESERIAELCLDSGHGTCLDGADTASVEIAITADCSNTHTVENHDRRTPTIIVTDTDTPDGRYSFVEINAENTFSEDCNSGTILHKNGCVISGNVDDEEYISDDQPFMQEINQLEQQADVIIDKGKRKKILITDLDSDTTEEITDFTLSGEESILPDLTLSQEASLCSDLTLSQTGSFSSNITVTYEGSNLSDATSSQTESILPDLTVSKEETSPLESLEIEKLHTDMGNAQPTDRLIDNRTYTAEPVQQVEAYPADNNNAYAYRTSSGPEPRTEVFVSDDNEITDFTNKPPRTIIGESNNLDLDQDPHSVGLHLGSNCLQKAIGRRGMQRAITDDVNQAMNAAATNPYPQPTPYYDTGTAGVVYTYNQPAGMSAYQTSDNQSVEIFHENPSDEINRSFYDNGRYQDNTETFVAPDDSYDNEPYVDDTEIFVAPDDQQDDSYEEFTN